MDETFPLDIAQPDRVVESRSGGVELQAAGDVNIGGDVVGRDKIVQIQQKIQERELTAAETAQLAVGIEERYLAEGVYALLQRLKTRTQDTAEAALPYRGLLAYRLSDLANFWGRAEETATVLQHLQHSPLMVLHSDSGAGKTSLIQAGVVPQLLLADQLPICVRPYDSDPALKIKREFVADLNQTPLLAQASLRDFLRRVSAILGDHVQLVIFLDQFEEFFTRLDEVRQAAFIGELAECLDDTGLNVRWGVMIRSEYFARLANFRPRIRDPFGNDYQLHPLGRDQARVAAEKPLEARGRNFEAGLLDRILKDLGGTTVNPPQLQLVCSALYEALPPGAKTITAALYEQASGVAGILRDHLEHVLSRELAPEQRRAARQLLESLITSERQRLIRHYDQLAVDMAQHGVTAQLLDVILTQLIENRLVAVEETDAGPVYELAHDYLLSEITLDPEVQARKAAQELFEQEVRAYHRHHTLLSADRLQVIEPFVPEFVLSAEGQELLAASQAQRDRDEAERYRQQQHLLEVERRSRRRLQGLVFVLSAILLGVLGIVVYREALRWEARRQGSPITVPGVAAALEQIEVNNDRYRLCVDAGVCSAPPPQYSTYFKLDAAPLPLTGVDAIQANQFCNWIGRRLPSLAEWQSAIRQPPDSWTVPAGLADRTLEWTATKFDEERRVATREVWNGAIDQLPQRLVVVGSTETSVLVDGVPADAVFRRADISFRCAADIQPSVK